MASVGEVTPEAVRFEMGACIGRGGFSEVYRATMRSPGGVVHDVAVKLLRTDVDVRVQGLERLRDEARLLGRLRHPAILHVHDVVRLDGRLGLVTEYVPGLDLDGCIAAGMPLRPLLEAIGDVADALAVVADAPDEHGRPMRLVHRDIKPSNLRVGEHGDVKLLDFGIAKALGAREAKTATGTLLGSRGYIAPERYRVQASVESPADVYALGATLYECIAGEGLFDTLNVEQEVGLALDAEGHDAWVVERLATLDAPEPIVDLIRRTLAHAPGERPSVRSLARACEEAAEAVPGPSLRSWIRTVELAPPSLDAGGLGGRVLTAQSASDTLVAAWAAVPATTRALPIAVGMSLSALAVGVVAALLAVAAWALWPTPEAPEPEPPVTLIEPEPAPEPPPAPVVAPVVAARPKPRPAPEPVALGTVDVTAGDALAVTLRSSSNGGGAGIIAPGAVPAGTYRVVAEFADWTFDDLEIRVDPGATVVVRCSSRLRGCAAAK